MNVKKVGLLIAITMIIIFVILFVPYERIYIKKSEPIKYLPNEKPVGLIEAYNNYIVLSYGTLLNRNEEEFFSQLLRFDSNESAHSYFSKVIEEWRNAGVNFELNSSDGQKVVVCKIIESVRNKERCGIGLIKGDKLIYVSGDKTRIEKVVRWFISQKL